MAVYADVRSRAWLCTSLATTTRRCDSISRRRLLPRPLIYAQIATVTASTQFASGLLLAAAAVCVAHGVVLALRARKRTQLAERVQQDADAVKESSREERKKIFESLNRQIREAEADIDSLLR